MPTNIHIGVSGSANLQQARTEVSKLQTQFKLLDAQMQRATFDLGKPIENTNNQLRTMGKLYAAQAAQTGQWQTIQKRVNDQTVEYTENLIKQKAALKDITSARKSGLSRLAYEEQLRLRSAKVSTLGRTEAGQFYSQMMIPADFEKSLDTARNRLGFMAAELNSSATDMINFGKNTQWSGRQLTVGFTVPLLAAGAATAYFANQTDRELTRIQKVYDTTTNENMSKVDQQIAKERELAQLRADSMETAKSAAQQYGASIQDTLQTQGELAATGVRGKQLQESTQETMRLATLGEMDYQTAVQATITLQSVFQQSSEDLTKTFNYMNAVENQTSLSMQDFATAIPIAAAPIKALGGDIKELSLLMVAMKARGVDASEGANAIKSAFNRLNNAGRAVKELFSEKTGKDLDQLIQSTGGKLIPTLQALGKSVEGLDDLSRQQVLGKLFGTYQNTRITAMLAGMTEDLNNVNSQVGRTLELSKATDGELAGMAQSELDRVAQSASGRLKRAVESIKVTLAEMGQPFLEMGAKLLEVTDGLLQAFNNLPGPLKTVMKIIAGGVAAAGPIGMLVGLGFNLTGTIRKLIANVVLLATKFEMLDRNSVIARKASEIQETAMQKQVATTQQLTVALEGLSKAFEDVTRSQTKASTSVAPISLNAVSGRSQARENYEKQATLRAERRAQEIENQYQHLLAERNIKRGEDGRYRKNGKFVSGRSVKGLRGPAAKRADALYAGNYGTTGMTDDAKSRLNDLRAARKERLAQAADAKRISAQEAQKQKEIAAIEQNRIRNQRLMVASGGLLTASLVASLVPLGEVGSKTEDIKNDIAQWAMVAGVALPAFNAIGPIFSKIGAGISSASGKISGSRGSMVGGLKTAVANAGGLRSAIGKTAVSALSLGGMINPWVTALAAAAGGAFLLYKHLSKAREEQQKLNEDASGLASIFGFTEREAGVQIDPKTGENIKTVTQQVKELNREYPALAKNINAAQGEENKFLIAAQQGIKAFNAGASEDQAKQVVVAALTAARGITEEEANRIILRFGFDPSDTKFQTDVAVKQLRDGLTKFEDVNLLNFWKDRGTSDIKSAAQKVGESMRSALEDQNVKSADESAKSFFSAYSSAVKGMDNVEMRQVNREIIKSIGDAIGASKGDIEDLLKKSDLGQLKNGYKLSPEDFIGIDPNELLGTSAQLASAVQKIKEQMISWNNLKNDLKSGKLTGSDKTSLSWVDPKDYQRYAKLIDLMTSGKGLTDAQRSSLVQLAAASGRRYLTEEQILSVINQQNDAMKAATPAQKQVESQRKAILDGLQKDLKGLDQQNDRENQALADRQSAAMDALESRHEATMDALDAQQKRREDAFDRQQERMEKRHDKEQRAFDKRWDKRIAKVEKEEDLRQRIFDAERNRIRRLAELQNATVNFNSALQSGNLDEAARVLNTQNAQEETNQLDDLDERARRRAEAKLEKLNTKRENAQFRLKTHQDAEKKALAATRKRYSDQVAAARDAAQKTYDAQRKSAENAHKAEKANLEKTQVLRKRNLERAIKAVTEYDARTDGPWKSFLAKLQKKFGTFSGNAKRAFDTAMAQAFRSTNQRADNFGSSNKWGLRSADAMEHWLKGAGKEVGMDPKQIKWFARKNWQPVNSATKNRNGGGGRQTGTSHNGGHLGSSPDSRKGYPQNADLYPSEIMVLAKKSEYMLQTSAHRKYGTKALDAVNEGKAEIITRHTGGALAFPDVADQAHEFKMEGVAKNVAYNIARLAKSRKAREDRAKAAATGNVGGGGFKKPTGKWNSPWRGHYAAMNGGHDYGLVDAPLYAPADGKLTTMALPGVETRRSHGGFGFRSYGQYLKFVGHGQSMMFAHLSKLPWAAGQTKSIKAGQYMGTTGQTGNTKGKHVHVELPFGAGNNNNFGNFFRSAGVSLRKGSRNIKYDNVPAILHKGEAVLTEDINKKFRDGVEAFANGGDTQYNIKVYIEGNATKDDADAIAKTVIKKIDRNESRKGRKR